MEQYFAKQLSNCCKLNFNHHVIKSQKPLLSPTNSPLKVKPTINKSQKRSLKRVHSDRALPTIRKINKNIEKNQTFEVKQMNQVKQFNDYGNFSYQSPKIQPQKTKILNQVFSAQNLTTPYVKNSEKKQLFTDSTKRILANQQMKNCYKQKNLLFQAGQKIENQHEVSHSKIEKNDYKQKNIFYVGQNPNPVHFQQVPNIYRSAFIAQNRYQAPNINKNSIQKSFLNKNHSLKNFTQKNKEINMQQSQYFDRIYGQVDIEAQIKRDLIKSLDFNAYSQTDSFQNKVSFLMKTPSSDQSTIIPLESKLTKKGDWSDTFNDERKFQTQKTFSAFQSQNQLSPKITIDRRQKFKSIISVDSEHESSSAVDSVIIEHHPQDLISSKPLKKLL